MTYQTTYRDRLPKKKRDELDALLQRFWDGEIDIDEWARLSNEIDEPKETE